jgi:hypothetical protein
MSFGIFIFFFPYIIVFNIFLTDFFQFFRGEDSKQFPSHIQTLENIPDFIIALSNKLSLKFF